MEQPEVRGRATGAAGGQSVVHGGAWRWSNVPIPESYLAAIVAGIVLHRLRPVPLLARPLVGVMVGGPVLTAGILLAAWAVSAAGRTIIISEPDRLVTGGPYALTRNPIYLGWTLIGAGIFLAMNAAWALLLLPAAVAFTHLVEIPREERYLQRKFGDAYRSYRSRVPRWL
jgi:protein-S-isoprenylcysteine O-methyltransferase Ste14